jgi:polysaccharide export outer membrane protein
MSPWRAARAGRVLPAAALAAGLLAVAGPWGCANSPAPPPPEEATGQGDDYVIGAADVLRIQVWRNPELSTDAPVRPDGRISVPLLNDIQAAGLTTEQLREMIAERMAEFVTAPDVTVIVTQVNSKNAYVVGEVVRPSAVPLTADMRVLDAIAIAGGFAPYADKDAVKILRRGMDGAVTEYRFDYGDFLKGRHPESNLLLRPGDTIVVPD